MCSGTHLEVFENTFRSVSHCSLTSAVGEGKLRVVNIRLFRLKGGVFRRITSIWDQDALVVNADEYRRRSFVILNHH